MVPIPTNPDGGLQQTATLSTSLAAVIVRLLSTTDDLAAFGRVVVAAYRSLAQTPRDYYEQILADVAARVAIAPVIGAFAQDGAPLGCVTFVPDCSHPLAEHDDATAASFRMLGVAPAAHGQGVGRALAQSCIDRARAENKARVVIHSTDSMTRAHALYEHLGFVRDSSRDWRPVPEVLLRGFLLEL